MPEGCGSFGHIVREKPEGCGGFGSFVREKSYISGMKRWLTILLIMVPVFTWCRGQSVRSQEEGRFWVTTQEDSLLAERILTDLRATIEKSGNTGPSEEALSEGIISVADLMVQAGKELLGQPYVAGTLDEKMDGDEWKEELRIYLTRTDCIIFVETCLALARTAAKGGDFQMFADEVRQSRYRSGNVGAYADRLHYTTEWARQGESRGVLKDVTRDLGGAPLDHPINYMSAHPGSYPLMDDPAAIMAAEDRLNARPRYYIPKNRLGDALKDIRTGDIICLVTSVEGLDISHVMMAVVENGAVRLLHASTGPMKVVMDGRTLPEYLAGRGSVIGIQVLRPLEVTE